MNRPGCLLASLMFAYPACAFAKGRLLWRGQTVSEVRAKTRDGTIAVFYRGMLEECRDLLREPPVPPPPSPSTSMDRSPGELGLAKKGQRRIVSLALAYLIDGDVAFRERAWSEIESWLDSWDSWTDPYHGPASFYDLMTGEMGVTMGLAYDWLDDLDEARRAKLREHLGRRIVDLYLENTKPPKHAWWFTQYNNWNAVCNGGAVIAALALGDEHPGAEEVIARATGSWRRYFSAVRKEGGWDEGTGYWQYGMRYGLMALAALKERGRDDGGLLKDEGLRRTALFPISFCPGELAMSWGDAGGRTMDSILYLFADLFRNADCVRYLDARAGSIVQNRKGWPTEALAVLWRPVGKRWLPKRGSGLSLATSRVYEEIGWSVFVDDWEKPRFAAGFKCGDLGASHTQLDNNTFQIWSNGEWLALDHGAGVYNSDYFSEKRWGMYVVSTAGHNGLLVDGEGQKPGMKGSLRRVKSRRGLDVVVGDASDSYGDGVTLARRHFAVVDRAYVVVVDEVRTREERKVKWLLHTAGSVAFRQSAAEAITGDAILRMRFPPDLVQLQVKREPGDLPPGKHETVLSAESIRAATSHVIPAVLLPASCGGGEARFQLSPAGLEVRVRRGPKAEDVLSWRTAKGGLAFKRLRRERPAG